MLIPVEVDHVRVLFDTEKNKYLAQVAIYDGTKSMGVSTRILEEK